jgi:hypothetical protein
VTISGKLDPQNRERNDLAPDGLMKHLITVCFVLLAAATASTGQPSRYGVTVTTEKNVDVAKFKTYSWTKGQPAEVKAVDAQITAAVDRELAGVNMTKVTSGTPDVLVAYYSLLRTAVKTQAKPDAKNVHPEYSVGTLMVALLEPGTYRRLVRMRIDKPIDAEPAQFEAELNAAVAELFTKYPTRKAK